MKKVELTKKDTKLLNDFVLFFFNLYLSYPKKYYTCKLFYLPLYL